MKVMLDSGAFSAWRKGAIIDLDEYGGFVKQNEHIFECCINLDVIGDGRASYENWMHLRRQGINTIPVYHVGTDESYLKKYLRKTDYICVGAVAKMSSVQRMQGLDRIWKDHLIDKKTKEPLAKVHGLGITAVDMIVRYPWYSVDSITPLLAAGYGGIFLPVIRKRKFDYMGLDVFKCSDQFRHEATSVGTFMNMPRTLRKRYEEFFEEMGFKLGKMTGVKNKLKKNEERNRKAADRLFDLPEEISDNTVEATLANHGKERRRWNLLMWHELGKALPAWNSPYAADKRIHHEVESSLKNSTIIYVGGTFDVLEEMLRIDVDLGFLFSYIVVNSNFIPRLKKTLS